MINLAIFASGGGSNAQKIIEHFRDHTDIQVRLIVSNNPNAGVLGIAEKEGIDKMVLSGAELKQPAFANLLVLEKQIKWISLAGFLKLIPVQLLRAYPGKIVNIHPALLPKYGGKGMYGMHVHESVFESKENVSGISIHFINEKYDEGPPIFQAICRIDSCRSPKEIRKNVLVLEHHYYPLVLEALMMDPVNQGAGN